jgi:hypothetical protein
MPENGTLNNHSVDSVMPTMMQWYLYVHYYSVELFFVIIKH